MLLISLTDYTRFLESGRIVKVPSWSWSSSVEEQLWHLKVEWGGTGKPGMLQSMKRVGHDLVSEQLQQPSSSVPGREPQSGKGLETELITSCHLLLSYRFGNINSNWRVSWESPGHWWLRIHLPVLGTWVWSLVGELRSHMPSGLHKAIKSPACWS